MRFTVGGALVVHLDGVGDVWEGDRPTAWVQQGEWDVIDECEGETSEGETSMAWRIVQQPNGLLARFSDIVDDFTDYHMTRDEAITECRNYLGTKDAEEKVQRGIDAGLERWQESLNTIRLIHGAERSMEVEALLSKRLSSDAEAT